MKIFVKHLLLLFVTLGTLSNVAFGMQDQNINKIDTKITNAEIATLGQKLINALEAEDIEEAKKTIAEAKDQLKHIPEKYLNILNFHGPDRPTALIIAIHNGNLVMVEMLIETAISVLGKKPNLFFDFIYYNNDNDMCSLLFAVDKGDPKIVYALLSAALNYLTPEQFVVFFEKKPDDHEGTPLDLAVREKAIFLHNVAWKELYPDAQPFQDDAQCLKDMEEIIKILKDSRANNGHRPDIKEEDSENYSSHGED